MKRAFVLALVLMLAFAATPALAEDGDSVGVVDPATGIWYLRNPATGLPIVFYYGNPADVPMMGDWDCDGVDTPGLYRQSDGYVYLRNSNTQGVADITFFFGNPGDIPVPGDFNNDGCDTVSLYRESQTRMYVINKLGEDGGGLGKAESFYTLGNPGDQPFSGDFNGDGIDTVGVYRPSTQTIYLFNKLSYGNADVTIKAADASAQLLFGDWRATGPDGTDTHGYFDTSLARFRLYATNTTPGASTDVWFGGRNTIAIAGSIATDDTPPPPPPPPPPPDDTFDDEVAAALDVIVAKAKATATSLPAGVAFPRSTRSDGSWSTVSASDWTSGFFPSLLWRLYTETGDPQLLSLATSWSSALPSQATRTDTHDVGFMVGFPARLALAATGDSQYRDLILTAATSLSSRFDPDVGATRSWDIFKDRWGFPVIIDNTVNLALLMDGADLTSSSGQAAVWRSQASTHAATTSMHHIRPDHSTYHVVDFDPDTGAVLSRETHQGAADESTWARGQAWAIYGFTTIGERTGSGARIADAQDLADWWLANVPADGVPYWDFDAPGIPNAAKDSSAAAIAALGMLELSELVTDSADSDRYYLAAKATLASLLSETYFAGGSTNALLLHGTGNHPGRSEIDVSLIYGDFFLVEALYRYQEIALRRLYDDVCGGSQSNECN